MILLSSALDAIEIDRFKNWHKYSNLQLLKIFSQEEIEYCLKIPIKSDERFAIRFAAKEAMYKAITSAQDINCSFIEFCKIIHIHKKENGAPIIQNNYKYYNRHELHVLIDSININLSMTHTKNLAIASIIITK